MPPDLCVVPPGPDVDPVPARFSGACGSGAWGGILPTALAVERVDPDGDAAVVYSFGARPQCGMEARFFLSRGCSVLVLMRKGHGGSDGPLAKEEGENEGAEMQVDSGVEHVHAAARMLAQLHVDPARVVVGGQPRGGLVSLAYAGRHPERVAAVLNSAGGWWGEGNDHNGFSRRQAARAGAGSEAPMSWLHGDRDPCYGLPLLRGMFEAFRAAGGRGALRTFDHLPGSGRALIDWQDRREAEVAPLVDDLGEGPAGRAWAQGAP